MRGVTSLVELAGGSAALLKKLNQASRDGQSLATRRNRIVHDPVLFNLDTKKVMASRMTANKRLEFDHVPIDISEWEDTVRAISAFRQRFIRLRDEIIAEGLSPSGAGL